MSQQHLLHEADPQRYSDLAITTVLVIKRVFRLTLRAAQGFIDSIFL
ncbi:transposase [Klebsiella pneumoniae]